VPAPGAVAPDCAQTLLLQRYYTAKAREVAAALHLPGKVFRSCALLLHRCFLDADALRTLDARTVMLACLYVAAKAEERYVSAEALAAAVGGAGGAAALLAAELPVLRAVGFALVTHHPQRALVGFAAAAAEHAAAPAGADVSAVRAAAVARCDAALSASDAALLHSPGALGLAALRAAAAGTPWQAAVEAVAKEALAAAGGGAAAEQAAAAASQALAAAHNAPPPSDEAVRVADRAWKLWRSAALRKATLPAAPVPSPGRGASPAPSPKRRRSGPAASEMEAR
jgi:hypothetical protein